MIAPSQTGKAHLWLLIQRFNNEDQAHSWKTSRQRKELLEALLEHTGEDYPGVTDEMASAKDAQGSVATAIITDVKPDTQEDYFNWECKIQSAQAKYPGYQGIYLQPPVPGRPGKWTTLLRFDSPDSLESWFESEERKALLAEAEKFISSTQFQKMSNSFPGWFPVDQLTGKGPANWKSAMLVMLGLYPIVMIEIWMLSSAENTWNAALRTFLNLVISVSFTTWVSMPLFVKQFGWWLLPAEDSPPSVHVKGFAIVSALLLSEVILLWNLLN